MQISTTSDAGSAPPRASLNDQLPRILIMGGAVGGFAIVAAEYGREYAHLGLRQGLALAGCFGLMLGGGAWEIRLGLRQATEAFRFWALAGFLGLLFTAIYSFNIESAAFSRFVAPLAFFGFIISHHLPLALRRPFFVLLSLVAICGVIGAASLPAAVLLLAASLVLIGVSHLPLPMWVRLAIIAVVVAGLAAGRAEWWPDDWGGMILPILASIFMFRLAVYLYDISHGKGPKDLWGRLAYFFMFPNMVLPFFPVVDFSTFGRTYYNAEALSIYRNGVSFVLRGVIHLLLYRIVYMFLVLAPDQVNDPVSFLQYIVANFGLYLKISGLFHLVCGVLVLFGFNLPETHTRFYFANSFIDFWRRINIYWKDFMQKMVFTPSYMQLKKLGVSHLTGVSLSILVVFLMTWALHAYQWFWITGTYLFTATDMLFWAILGLLLIVQTLLESRPKAAAIGRGLIGPRTLLVVRTACTFLFICLLWSFWTSPTVEDWLVILRSSGLAPVLAAPEHAGPVEWLQTIMFVLAVLAMTAVALGLTFGLANPSPTIRYALRKPATHRAFYPPIAIGSAATVLVLSIQLLAATSTFGPEVQSIASSIGSGNLNRADRALLTRGYYEDLAGEGIKEAGNNLEFLNALTPSRRSEGEYRPLPTGAGIRSRQDYLLFEFVPNTMAQFSGSTTTYPINRWGMNDRDYSLEKPAGAFRVAMIGASRLQGLGLEHSQRFETILEERLNRDQASDGTPKNYELLNFGAGSYQPVQRLMSFEEKALQFQPDAVIYEAGLIELWVNLHGYMVREGVAMPYPFLTEINRKAGVTASMSQVEVERRLNPYRAEIVSGVYRRLVSLAKDRGMQAIWLYIPDPGDRLIDVQAMERAAQEAGFVTTRIDDEFDPRKFQQSLTDSHPNEAGNKLIADLIYERLLRLQLEGRINFGLRPIAGAASPSE